MDALDYRIGQDIDEDAGLATATVRVAVERALQVRPLEHGRYGDGDGDGDGDGYGDGDGDGDGYGYGYGDGDGYSYGYGDGDGDGGDK